MRVQIRMAGAGPGDGEGKANQFIAIECADDLPADLAADHEHAQRNQVHIIEVPDLFLQGDTGLKFLHAVAFADGNSVDTGNRGAHRVGSSIILACCHKASISSSVASSSV